MDDRPEGQGVGQAREPQAGEGAQGERGEGARQQQSSPSGQPPQGGARRGERDPRERDPRDTRDPRRRRQPPQQQQQGGREGQQQQQTRRPEASINMGELRELFGMFTAQGLTEFELEKEGFRVRLRRDLTPPGSPAAATASGSPPLSAVQPSAQVLPFVAPQVTPVAQQEGAAAAPQAPPAETRRAEDEAAEQLHVITSPIVGTFYRSPSPTADPFVRQGSRVEPDTVVCIIEAMKLMNEILAEASGMVEEVYVENGQPVEYGQALFGIRK